MDLPAIEAAQASGKDHEILRRNSSLNLKVIPVPTTDGTIRSTVISFPVVPLSQHCEVFETLYVVLHTGICAPT